MYTVGHDLFAIPSGAIERLCSLIVAVTGYFVLLFFKSIASSYLNTLGSKYLSLKVDPFLKGRYVYECK